MAIKKTTASRS